MRRRAGVRGVRSAVVCGVTLTWVLTSHGCTRLPADSQDEADYAAVARLKGRIRTGMSPVSLSQAVLAAEPRSLDVSILTLVCGEPVERGDLWDIVRRNGKVDVRRAHPGFPATTHTELSEETLTPIIQAAATDAQWATATCRETTVVVGRWAVTAYFNRSGQVESVGRVDATHGLESPASSPFPAPAATP
jgi:hypothetical protein